jgi:hypothetical protein
MAKGLRGCDRVRRLRGIHETKKANPKISLQRCFAHIRRRFVDIVKRRNRDHPKILEELKSLIFDLVYKAGLTIEQAAAYTNKVWTDLLTYLSSGYVEISNNNPERAVRPFVINRKVFMTAGSYDGARYSTRLFSIIRTARINNLNVSKYLEYILDNIHSKEMDDLLPYSPSIIRVFTKV